MSPLQLQILLHYHCFCNDYPDLTPPAQREAMFRFVRDLGKALYANSATATITGQFRKLHTQVRNLHYSEDEPAVDPDLNLIDANRFFCVNYVLEYHSYPYDI